MITFKVINDYFLTLILAWHGFFAKSQLADTRELC